MKKSIRHIGFSLAIFFLVSMVTSSCVVYEQHHGHYFKKSYKKVPPGHIKNHHGHHPKYHKKGKKRGKW